MAFGLVTSQNITAPKQLFRNKLFNCCLVTSQNITAPKRINHGKAYKRV